MAPAKYADSTKQAKDLLTKPYATSNKVEVKTSSDGVTFTTEAIIGKPSSIVLKGEFALLEGFKVDKLQLCTDTKLALEVSNASLVKNTKFFLKGTDASRAAGAGAISASLGAEYALPSFTATLEVNALEHATLPVDCSAVFAYDGFLVGAAASGGLKSLSLTDANVLFGYKSKTTAATLATEKSMKTLALAVHQAVTPELTVGALAKLPTSGAGKLELSAGLGYKLSPEATLHAKVNQAGKVGLSYATALGSAALPTKFTLSVELDAANVASDDHRFNFGLNMTC